MSNYLAQFFDPFRRISRGGGADDPPSSRSPSIPPKRPIQGHWGHSALKARSAASFSTVIGLMMTRDLFSSIYVRPASVDRNGGPLKSLRPISDE